MNQGNVSREQFFEYPKSMDDETVDPFTREQFRSVHEAYGSGDTTRFFGSSGSAPSPTPWPRAARRKSQRDYDPDVVRQALEGPQELSDVDPRHLHSTQPTITREGVDYYMGDEYERTGTTFADQGNAGNRFPVVYEREGVNMLLSGHHRASAALLQGRPLSARKVVGPWGPAR